MRNEATTSDATPEDFGQQVRRRFRLAGYGLPRLVECEYAQGVVVLRGTVPTYYYKQIAQAVLMSDPLVETVVNLIEVSQGGCRVARSE